LLPQVWPGPVTLVLPAGKAVPRALIASDGSWAVRVPDNPWCRALASAVGGVLPSSSANLPGSPPCRNAGEVEEELSRWVALVVEGGAVPADTPASALADAREWPPELLRGSHPVLDSLA